MKKSLGARTLVYPTPVFVVGSYNDDGRPNVMTAAWGGICNSRPPSVAVSLRPATLTHGNVVKRKAFTISIPSEDYAQQADYFGLASGREADKFGVTGLTAVASEVVDAPYVGEFPLVLECRVVATSDLGLHTQFVGEVVDIKADAEVFLTADCLDIKRVRPLLFAPDGRGYYGVGEFLGRAFEIGKAYVH